jgi:hypothetical protein
VFGGSGSVQRYYRPNLLGCRLQVRVLPGEIQFLADFLLF